MTMQQHSEIPQKQVTPPNSFIVAPLTPPPTDFKPNQQVQRLLRLIRRVRNGDTAALKSEWHKFKLLPGEYDELFRLVKGDESLWAWAEDKFRYDYNSTIYTFVLRMPSDLHDVFTARVVEEILNNLRAFEGVEGPASAFAKKIKHNGSGTMDMPKEEPTIRRQPDAKFKHCEAHWPGVIIEVSYSQKTKDLPYLADDYILETDGSVRAVIGLDIDYKTRQGTISMWRPNYIQDEHGKFELEAAQTLDQQVFHDASGPNTSQDAGLKLKLKDFAPEDLAQGISESDSFLIDSATLSRMLVEAEQEEQERNRPQGVVQQLRPGAKKRRRERTPPDEVNSEDDRNITNDERRVRARVSEDDSSYKSSQPDLQIEANDSS